MDQVERLQQRVVLVLRGADGPLGWRDLKVSPDGALALAPDSSVEFSIEIREPTG